MKARIRIGFETCIISGKITYPKVFPFIRVAWKVHRDPWKKISKWMYYYLNDFFLYILNWHSIGPTKIGLNFRKVFLNLKLEKSLQCNVTYWDTLQFWFISCSSHANNQFWILHLPIFFTIFLLIFSIEIKIDIKIPIRIIFFYHKNSISR